MRVVFSSFFSLILLCDFIPLMAEETLLKPWVPREQQIITGGTVVGGIVTQIPRSQAAAIPLVHFSTSQPAHALNLIKGAYGEGMMDSVFTSRLLKTTGGWSAATPASIGRAGIDGLYFKMDKNGLPRDLLISDAKYGSATLNKNTKDGIQMGEKWIKSRLTQTRDMYRELSSDISKGNITRANGATQSLAGKRVTIPLNNKTSIDIWRADDGGIRYFCSDKSVTPTDIQQQLNRFSKYLDGAAEGKITYRARLFSYRPEGKEHVFTISELDANARVTSKPQVIRGEFSKLPRVYRETIISQVNDTLERMGKPRSMASEILNNPKKFNQLCVKPRWPMRAGLDSGVWKLAGIMGVVGMGIDGVSQYWEKGEVNVSRMMTMGALSGTSVIAGNYAGTQTSLLLARSGGLLGKLAGPLAGGGVGSFVFSYGLYAMGYSDLQTAHRTFAAGVSATVITSFIFTKSAVVAGSGGAVFAGGGGMAAFGGSVLATGGTVVIFIASYVVIERTIYYTTYFKDERDRHRYICELIDLTQKRVQENKQLEWRMTGE